MAEETAEVEDGKKKKGKMMIIIPAVVLLAGIGGGGYFFLGSKKAAACPATSESAAAVSGVVQSASSASGPVAFQLASSSETTVKKTATKKATTTTVAEEEATDEEATDDSSASSDCSSKKEEKEEPGPIIRLSPITMNLSDGHVLKVGLALQLKAKPEDKELAAIVTAATASGEGHSGGDGSISQSPMGGAESKALDAAITDLGNSTFATLSSPEGRAAAKKQLTEDIEKAYHGDVEAVYFTDFVMS